MKTYFLIVLQLYFTTNMVYLSFIEFLVVHVICHFMSSITSWLKYIFIVLGAWKAVRDVYPMASIQGCVFHWTQAVWRHVQELGLSATYRQKGGMHSFIRQLLALPFLPPGHILDAFNNLRQRATTAATQQLVEYIDRQWMRNSVFAIADWCVYEKTVRTNNDCEGKL